MTYAASEGFNKCLIVVLFPLSSKSKMISEHWKAWILVYPSHISTYLKIVPGWIPDNHKQTYQKCLLLWCLAIVGALEAFHESLTFNFCIVIIILCTWLTLAGLTMLSIGLYLALLCQNYVKLRSRLLWSILYTSFYVKLAQIRLDIATSYQLKILNICQSVAMLCIIWGLGCVLNHLISITIVMQ